MTCPDGHESTGSDFCSECGLRMPADETTAPRLPSGVAREACPACRTERDDPGSPFCGVCGYDFVTRRRGDAVPVAAPPPPPPPAARAPVIAVPAAPASAPHLEIEITFDEGKPEAPRGTPPRKFSLYDEESLIGRRSSSTPQTVGLEGDDFISRRHLLVVRQPAGGYAARLFDNTNGGTHNGSEMVAGVEVPLAPGDVLAIGSFTILQVSAIKR